MKNFFIALINTLNGCGKITNAHMYDTISTIDLELNGKKYVFSIRLEEEKKDA